ncbi:MAG: hypothetical protein ACLR56_04485 [Oscillospiraceae bacterium]
MLSLMQREEQIRHYAEAVGGGIYGVCSDTKGVPLPILNLIRVTAEHTSVIAKPSCP